MKNKSKDLLYNWWIIIISNYSGEISNPLTLRFKEVETEQKYNCEKENMGFTLLFACYIVQLTCFIVSAIILPM